MSAPKEFGVIEQNQVAFDEAPVGMAIVDRQGRFLRVTRR